MASYNVVGRGIRPWMKVSVQELWACGAKGWLKSCRLALQLLECSCEFFDKIQNMIHIVVSFVSVVCSVLQCGAVCCSVLQCVAVCCSVLQCVAVCCSVWQCVAVCCSALQCVAVCCSVWQCVAEFLFRFVRERQVFICVFSRLFRWIFWDSYVLTCVVLFVVLFCFQPASSPRKIDRQTDRQIDADRRRQM